MDRLMQLNSGKVVAVGPGARDRSGNVIPVAVKEGETVLLPDYGGTQVKLGEKEYVLMPITLQYIHINYWYRLIFTGINILFLCFGFMQVFLIQGWGHLGNLTWVRLLLVLFVKIFPWSDVMGWKVFLNSQILCTENFLRNEIKNNFLWFDSEDWMLNVEFDFEKI